MMVHFWKLCLLWQWLLWLISFTGIRTVTYGYTSTMNILAFLLFQAFCPVRLRLETEWLGWDLPIPQSVDVIADCRWWRIVGDSWSWKWMVEWYTSWSCDNTLSSPTAETCDTSINLVSGPMRGTFHSIVSKEIQLRWMKLGRLRWSSFWVHLGNFRNACFPKSDAPLARQHVFIKNATLFGFATRITSHDLK